MSYPELAKRPVIGLLCLFLAFILSGIVACTPQESGRSPTPMPKLNAVLMAELALKRNQYSTAYDYYEEAIADGLTSTDFKAILVGLKGRQHDSFRSQVVTQWYKQYPKDMQALSAYTRQLVCNGDSGALNQLAKFNKNLTNKSRLSELFTCLPPEQQLDFTRALLASDNNPELRMLQCQLLALQGQYDLVLTCLGALEPNDETISSLKLKAQALQALEQLKLAEDVYQDILNKAPNDNGSRYELAMLYYQTNQFTRAIAELQTLLETEPNNRNVHYLLASSYFSIDQLEASKKWFEGLLKVVRYRNSALYYLGMIAIELEQSDKALGLLDSVTDSEFYLPAQLNKWRLISESDPDLAVEGLYQLIEALPSERMTIKLAQIDILERAEQDQRATQEVVSLADDYPKNLRLQILRIQWLIDRNYLSNLDANLSASLDGMDDNQDQKRLVENTIFYLIEQQLGASATLVLKAQNIIPPDSEQYQFLMALANILNGDFDAGLAPLEKLQKSNPSAIEYRNALAYSLILAGVRYDEAESILVEVLEEAPDNASYMDSLGWLYFKRGDYDKAGKYLQRANELLSSASIKGHLVEYYLQVDEVARAKELLQEALALFPRHRVLTRLEQIHELQ